MHKVLAMVLAGGRVEELSALTLPRTKAAVPFGGQYRLIDFAMSSLARSEIERVGVISLYRPSSLIDHVGGGEPWDLAGRGRGVKILPPFQMEEGTRWYAGTADAVYQNLAYVERHEPTEVLIVSGDHVYGMDFRPVVKQHRETNADLTMVVKALPAGSGHGQFGFAEVDKERRVTGYEEKPAHPRTNLASLTMYLFDSAKLFERLEENCLTGSSRQLYDEVIPEMVGKDRVFAFPYEGYWNYTRSIGSYMQANLDLLGENPSIDLVGWNVRSRCPHRGLGDLPPARLAGECSCTSSLLGRGVLIDGTVSGSILSPGVRIEAGAQVVDSVLFNDCLIRYGARVERAILDKGVCIGREARVGGPRKDEPGGECKAPASDGVTVIGKGARVPAGTVVETACVIYPRIVETDWPGSHLASGARLGRGGQVE